MDSMIPPQVSGREVTNRGIHLLPFGFHGTWCGPKAARSYWLTTMQAMHVSWCVLITDGDSCLEVFDGKEVVAWLLDAGIIPIIRWQAPINRQFTGVPVVRRLLPLYERHGLKPWIQLYNEPGDPREWVGDPPRDWWQLFIQRWKDAAHQVLNEGGLAGFPDGPGYNFQEQHPFRDTADMAGSWRDGSLWYGVHNYAKGRPLDYPMDSVSQTGLPELTEDAYSDALDDFAQDPAWRDQSITAINAARKASAKPGMTTMDDDVCWMSWRKIDHHARDALGFSVTMGMTEGGWQPRDRPGSKPEDIDIRWPLTTPRMVAKRTLAMFEADSPLLFQCPWLLACSSMGGSGWEYDAWVGWAFYPEYGWEKPVIQCLKDNPPRADSVQQKLQVAHSVLAQALDLL